MDLNFYSELSDGCAQNVDSEFLDPQAYGGYSQGNKVSDGVSIRALIKTIQPPL